MFRQKFRPQARRPRALPAAAAWLTVSMSAALAQNTTLEEVLVSARSIEDTLALELEGYGHDVEFISAERIAAAGYIDVSAALQYETPGLFVSPGSGPFDYVDVSLQGSRTGDVLWLIDGVRINNRIFNDTSPDTLPAGMVERIEILKGGESLFYGTQGVAGAINIVTRAFSEKPSGSVALTFDGNDGRHASGHASGTFGAHKFVAYASKNEGDGYRQYGRYEASATDRDRSYDVASAGFKYGYDLSPRIRLDALYHHTDAVLDNNSAARTRRSYNDRDEDVINAKLAFDATDAVQLILKTYMHDWDTTYANIQNDPRTGEEVVVFPPGTYWGYRDYGASGLAKFTPAGAAEYHLGYDYQNYKARDDVYPIAGEVETVHALFGHVRSTPEAFQNLSLAGGLRYNRGSGGKDATLWNVSGRYTLSDSLYLEGAAATGFLLPSAEQLYYLGASFDDYAGNPDLALEKSANLNLSIGGALPAGEGRMSWRLTGFARDIDHLIDVGYDDPRYPNGRYENVAGAVKVRGAEAQLSAPLGRALTAEGSYAYTRSRNEGSDAQRPRTPLRVAKATVRFAPPQSRFETSATMSWTGDLYQNVGAFGRRNFGDYFVLNLAGRAALDDAHRHRLGLHLQNALDERYATRLSRAPRDDGSGYFLVQRLGVPRTLSVTYSYAF